MCVSRLSNGYQFIVLKKDDVNILPFALVQKDTPFPAGDGVGETAYHISLQEGDIQAFGGCKIRSMCIYTVVRLLLYYSDLMHSPVFRFLTGDLINL